MKAKLPAARSAAIGGGKSHLPNRMFGRFGDFAGAKRFEPHAHRMKRRRQRKREPERFSGRTKGGQNESPAPKKGFQDPFSLFGKLIADQLFLNVPEP